MSHRQHQQAKMWKSSGREKNQIKKTRSRIAFEIIPFIAFWGDFDKFECRRKRNKQKKFSFQVDVRLKEILLYLIVHAE